MYDIENVIKVLRVKEHIAGKIQKIFQKYSKAQAANHHMEKQELWNVCKENTSKPESLTVNGKYIRKINIGVKRILKIM